MTIHTTATDTILAIDFGAANTRALLFDVVESSYRLVGAASAPSTVEAPYRDASEGMRHALLELQAITGRALLDDGARLIIPATPTGTGADALVATSSAGRAVRAILVGLLPDVSLESARRTAASSYVTVLDRFSLAERRGDAEMIDAVIAAQPDLVLIAGGTDDGARDALLKLVESVSLACHLLPPGHRTRALYMGNPAAAERVGELLGRVATVRTAPNVLPALGAERLVPARAELASLLDELRLEQIGGLPDLALAAGGRIVPTAQAAGLYYRFLSKLPDWPQGVLGIDVGSASTIVAAARQGELYLNVRPDLGIGVNAAQALAEGSLEAAMRWVPMALGDEAYREFVLNKAARPNTVPPDADDLALEHALARQVMRLALRRARADWPASLTGGRPDQMPAFSLIVGGGAVLGQAPRPGLAALMMLDTIQPVGLTRLMLDPYHLAAALGAASYVNPVLVAQVTRSLALLDLGTAVSLQGRVQPGEVACLVRLVTTTPADGAPRETELEVKAGTLEMLPLGLGQTARLTLQPRPGLNAGFGPGRTRTVPVRGGALGVIIDARGRPLAFSREPEMRRQAVSQWIAKLGGS